MLLYYTDPVRVADHIINQPDQQSFFPESSLKKLIFSKMLTFSKNILSNIFAQLNLYNLSKGTKIRSRIKICLKKVRIRWFLKRMISTELKSWRVIYSPGCCYHCSPPGGGIKYPPLNTLFKI